MRQANARGDASSDAMTASKAACSAANVSTAPIGIAKTKLSARWHATRRNIARRARSTIKRHTADAWTAERVVATAAIAPDTPPA